MTTATAERITEARAVVLTEAIDPASGTFELQIITPGQGSSGWYSPEVLETAVNDGMFAKGTHLYVNHPTASEEFERPERDVRDLAGGLIEDGRWTGQAVVAKANVLSQYRTLLAEAAPLIGMSIRGGADVSEGTAAGRTGRIIEKITAIDSVDFVTRPGRGGAVLAVVESARAIEAGTLNSDMHELLNVAVKDAHGGDSGGEGPAAYVRDFDDTDVYFVRYSADDSGTFRQGYTRTDNKITLTGEPTEVRAVTEYVPVETSPGDGTTTESAGGQPMPDITESEIASLREAAGKVKTLESELATATTRAEKAEAELAQTKARTAAVERARARVVDQNGTLDADVVDVIVEKATRSIPLTEAGALDEAALDTATDAARTAEETYLARQRGARTVRPALDGGSGVTDEVAEAAEYLTALDAKLDNRIGAR